MSESDVVAKAKQLLVAANRILGFERVVDGYGHVSMRHPENPNWFLCSRSRAPELVSADDIMTFDLAGKAVGDDPRPGYLERFIHGSLYAARPDVNGVVHSHAEDVVPYSICGMKLEPVFHQAARMGTDLPVWEISEKFGATNLLVTNVAQGDDLAQKLGQNSVVLMRGHGFAAVAPTVQEVVTISVYLPINARILSTATLFGRGPVKTISQAELDAMGTVDVASPAFHRGWEYWCKRAGVTP